MWRNTAYLGIADSRIDKLKGIKKFNIILLNPDLLLTKGFNIYFSFTTAESAKAGIIKTRIKIIDIAQTALHVPTHPPPPPLTPHTGCRKLILFSFDNSNAISIINLARTTLTIRRKRERRSFLTEHKAIKAQSGRKIPACYNARPLFGKEMSNSKA